MPDTNASFSPSRSERLQSQIDKLETLSHPQLDFSKLADFDVETEQLLSQTFGETDRKLETYKYATMGEAASLVNLPEAAQEASDQDTPQKAIQQRRQVLEGCLSELREVEDKETEALAGEDHEDPPGMS